MGTGEAGRQATGNAGAHAPQPGLLVRAFGAAPNGVIATAAAGRSVAANPRLAQLLSLSLTSICLP